MIEAWLNQAVGVVWNYPVVGLCLFTGIFFTLRMAFIQLRCLPHALALLSGKYDNPDEPGQITHFQALSAALSGTIGLGNIAGVAIAIAMGGPGAVFWMWIVGFFGMATKFAECALGTIYRVKEPHSGKLHGGPMHYITNGLGKKWWPMAAFFSVCTIFGSFGFANMFQANQVSAAMSRYYQIPDWITGIALATLVALTIIGGIKRIGSVAGKVVPAMCGLYLLATLYICITHIDLVPVAHWVILKDAFSGQAAAGGAIGVVVIMGVRRAIFSNEAGMGSAPIAHATVKTDQPVREGIVASVGPFIDTIVVCTATAMVIIIGGLYGNSRWEGKEIVHPEQAFVMTDTWDVSSKAPVKQQDPLVSVRDGNGVLHFEGQGAQGSVTTPPLSIWKHLPQSIIQNDVKTGSRIPFDGFRFSCHHEGGGRKVDLLNTNGSVIGTLPLTPEGASTEFFKIDGCRPGDGWHTHVIQFTDQFKKHVRKRSGTHELQLRFTGLPTAGAWFIDKIESVTDRTGIELTAAAFDSFFGTWGGLALTIAIFFFCYSTMITWSYYGQTAIVYLFGHKAIVPYRWAFVGVVFLGAVTKLTIVLSFSDLMAGLMVVPNAIAILLLSNVVARETRKYYRKLNAGEFEQPNKVLREKQ